MSDDETLKVERDYYLEGFEALRRGTQDLLDAVRDRDWQKAKALRDEMVEAEASRKKIILDRDGTLRATGWAVNLLSRSIYEWLDALGAENNCQWRFTGDPQGRELTLTAQWSTGQTPMEMRAASEAENARLREALADAEKRHQEHMGFVQLGAFRVGLETAASWHEARAAALDLRRAHAEKNPEIPEDLRYNHLEDLREEAAQDRLDAKTFRDLAPPASFHAVAIEADARLRAQHDEQVQDLRDQRDASHRREEELRARVQVLESSLLWVHAKTVGELAGARARSDAAVDAREPFEAPPPPTTDPPMVADGWLRGWFNGWRMKTAFIVGASSARACEGSEEPPRGVEIDVLHQDGGAFVVCSVGERPRTYSLARTFEIAAHHRTHPGLRYRWLAVDRTGRATTRPVIRRSVVALLEREGRFAAIRSVKHGGAVELPGGKLQDGEAPAEAALREVREEVGVEVTVLQGLGDFLHKHDGTWWCAHAFVVVAATGDLVGGAEGEAFWATRGELLAGTYRDVVARLLATYDRLPRRKDGACEACEAFAVRAASDPDGELPSACPDHGGAVL